MVVLVSATSTSTRLWSIGVDLAGVELAVELRPERVRGRRGRSVDRPRTTCPRCHATSPAGSAFCGHCGASTALGPVLAGSTVLRILGQGGASVVYLAGHEPRDGLVAIKVLRRDVDEPKVWKRFLREARMVARLSGHSNVSPSIPPGGRRQVSRISSPIPRPGVRSRRHRRRWTDAVAVVPDVPRSDRV